MSGSTKSVNFASDVIIEDTDDTRASDQLQKEEIQPIEKVSSLKVSKEDYVNTYKGIEVLMYLLNFRLIKGN